MATTSFKNLPLSPAINDLGLGGGDALTSQVQANIINAQKKKQVMGQSPTDQLYGLMANASSALQSLYPSKASAIGQ